MTQAHPIKKIKLNKLYSPHQYCLQLSFNKWNRSIRLNFIQMHLLNKFLLSTLIAFIGMNMFSQTNSNWPYSVYGIGDIQQNGFGQSKAMGGVGIALPCETSLNNINPAALQGIDKNTVILDFGLNSRWSQFSDGLTVQNNNNLFFNYFSLGFRTSDRWVCSIGLAPYSIVGASIVGQQPLQGVPGTYIYDYYSASGGLNQLYWGNSIKITKNLSIGLNIKYLFGSVTTTQSIAIPGISGFLTDIDNRNMSNLIMDYGFLYSFSVNHNITGSVGGICSNPWTLAERHEETNLDFQGDTLKYLNDTLSTYKLPLTFGLGVSLKFYNKLTVAFDYSYGQWSKSFESLVPNATLYSFDQTTNIENNARYVDSNNFNFGMEYHPSDAYNASFINKIKYRIGARYSNLPLEINGSQFTDYAFSCGVGLPVLRNKMNLNIAVEVGHRSANAYGLIDETYGNVMFNLTLQDIWFLKRKFN